MPPRRSTLPYAVFGPRTALLALLRRAGITKAAQLGKVLLSHTGHSAAIYTAQGDLYDVSRAEKLPRRSHGVPRPVGAATGTEAARPQDNACRREGARVKNEKQCRTHIQETAKARGRRARSRRRSHMAGGAKCRRLRGRWSCWRCRHMLAANRY